MAKLHFKYGAMNSGKTAVLINAAYNYLERNLNVAVVKPSKDTKGEDYIVSRAGGKWKVDLLVNDNTDLFHELPLSNLHCVIVDEAQFLSVRHVEQLFILTKAYNISVIAYGLRTDFKGKSFDGSRRLLELADNIEKLPTMCFCGRQAEFNCRLNGTKASFTGKQVAIDGVVEYISLCGECFLDKGYYYEINLTRNT
jgi:thymidine kinase